MTQLTIIATGTVKERYLRDAIAEYEKRLSSFCRVENLILREEPIKNEDNDREIAAALEREGEAILSRIPEGARVFALCIEGKEYDSHELARLVGDAVDCGGKLCFIIGSSHGLSPRVKARADVRLSFSRLTFPHQLVRVILLESVYRSFSILAGKRYHK